MVDGRVLVWQDRYLISAVKAHGVYPAPWAACASLIQVFRYTLAHTDYRILGFSIDFRTEANNREVVQISHACGLWPCWSVCMSWIYANQKMLGLQNSLWRQILTMIHESGFCDQLLLSVRGDQFSSKNCLVGTKMLPRHVINHFLACLMLSLRLCEIRIRWSFFFFSALYLSW